VATAYMEIISVRYMATAYMEIISVRDMATAYMEIIIVRWGYNIHGDHYCEMWLLHTWRSLV